jgi:hydroxyacylglutathione hydrolase
VQGSIHAPYQKLRDGIPDEIRNTLGKPLAIVCGSGVRSALAATIPRRSGIRNVEHVAEGGVPDLAADGIGLVEGE